MSNPFPARYSLGGLIRTTLKYLRPTYPATGFLLRVAFDLAMANAGYLFGYMACFVYYALLRNHQLQERMAELLTSTYARNAPIFTVICLVCFWASGLYGRGPGEGRSFRLFLSLRAVIAAAAVYGSLAYLLDPNLVPTISNQASSWFVGITASAIGWACVALLVVSGRVTRSVLYRSFVILPRHDAEGLAKVVGEFSVAVSEFGYVPPQPGVEASLIAPRFAQWPRFDAGDIRAVARVLQSGKVNRWTGEENLRFEAAFAQACGATYAIALANGTLALELALVALEIGPGDEVIVPCRTFIASASCVVMRGATPVVVDVDRESQNLTAATIEPALTERTRAIIAVHLNGWPCDMDPIRELARARGIRLIEDCAQSLGASYKGRPCGSLGDLAAFSFCQDKIITTGGEGGMLVTDDETLYRRAWAYKDHGKDYETVHHKTHQLGFRWLHHGFGTNWRMTEMQAALGRRMLEKLEAWVLQRRYLAEVLANALADAPGLRVPAPAEEGVVHAYYKFYAFVEPAALAPGWDRDRVMAEIVARGVPCFTGICGQIHQEKAFDAPGLRPARELPVSRELMDTGLMFLVHPTLTPEDIERAGEQIRQVMDRAVSH